jgi:glucuronoarabinoxylan endo-1,4-beta-xylanase
MRYHIWIQAIACVVTPCFIDAVCFGARNAPAEDVVVPALDKTLPEPTANSEAVAIISSDDVQQNVDGFGFSTAWRAVPGTPENDDAFLSVTKGAGFSILRNRVPFNESNDEFDDYIVKQHDKYVFTTGKDDQGTYKNFQLRWNDWDLKATRKLLDAARANPDYRLTKVFSTPWTPPNNPVERWKHITDPAGKAKHPLTEASYATHPEVGGYLDPAHYQDYADLLADYVLGFKPNMKFDLYALSLQNEPNFDCGYESCDWTADQFHDFLLVLKKEFTRKGVWKACPDLKIMAPEDNNFRDSLLSAVYADPATRDIVQIAAGHQYEYGTWSMGKNINNLFTDRDAYQPNTFDASYALKKQIWMTEWNLSAFHTATEINQALVVARMVHQDFTRSHLNAFVFWWSPSLLGGRGTNVHLPTKSLWALAQYSRFVRPGWKVIPSTVSPVPGVYLTSFTNNDTKRIAVVAVNTQEAERIITLSLSGTARFSTLNLYRTSPSENMLAVGSMKINASNRVISLPPSSISTFYGNVTP